MLDAATLAVQVAALTATLLKQHARDEDGNLEQSWLGRKLPRVVDHHLLRCQHHTLRACIAAIGITPGQHLAIAV